MDAIPPDKAADDHRRRELDFMRELQEQSGERDHPDDGPAVSAAADGADEPVPPDEPAA